jgi:predicted acyl esterase
MALRLQLRTAITLPTMVGFIAPTFGQNYKMYSEKALKGEPARTAIIESAVPAPMRDGVSLSTAIYRKDVSYIDLAVAK